MNEEVRKCISAIENGIVPEGYKKTKLGIVPENWNLLRFFQITRKTGNKQKNSDSDYPVYSINNKTGFTPQSEQFENNGYSNTSKSLYKIVYKGEFAYNPARINIGSIGLLKDKEAVIISSLYVCFAMAETCSQAYFEQYFKSHRFYYDVNNYTEGSVREYLFYENFSKIPVVLPPLSEQQKIAEILNMQDKLIELKQKLIDSKKQQKKYLMQQLLTGKIRLKGFTGEWKKVKLSEIAEIIMGQSPDSKFYNNIGGGIPLIQGNADIDNRKLNPRMFTSQITKICQIDDIIMSVRAPVGTIATAQFQACIGRGVCAIRSSFKEYLFQYLKYIEDKWNKFSQGSTFESINSKELCNLKIIFPPLEEQTKIVEILSMQDKEIQLLETELELQKQKKKTLMHLLLTGKVRVKI